MYFYACVCVDNRTRFFTHKPALFVCFPELLFLSYMCVCVDFGKMLRNFIGMKSFY